MIMAFICAGWIFIYLLGAVAYECSGGDVEYSEKSTMLITLVGGPGVLMAIAFVVTASISFKRILDETSPLEEWEAANGCVAGDPLMQMGEHGVQANQSRKLWAILSLTGAWLIFCMQCCSLCMSFGGQ